MGKVYVVQNQHQRSRDGGDELVPKFDLRPAERFGEITFLLSPTARPFSPAGIIRELHTKLKHYTTNDHLLLLGNPALIGLVVAIAALHGHGKLSLLQWDGRSRDYITIQADIW